MRILSVFLLTLVSISYSGIETQTDWSGGDGVPGPVVKRQLLFSFSDN